MRRGLIQICALLALLLLTAVAQAQDAYSTNADGSIYTYSTNADGSADIVAYAGPPWVVTIPTNINGLTVSSIGYEAFYGDSLTSMTIPASVTSIGFGALYECSSLTSVTIPNSVTNIGACAFYYCSSLTNMTIPASVTSIWDQAFLGCTHLTSITVDASNPAYSSMNGALFDKAQATLLQFPAGGLGGSYTIPASVTSIGYGAFWECSSLTSVTIPNSVTNIGTFAFYYCSSLTSMTIPASVTSIGVDAFFLCVGLTNVTIPNSVTNIGFAAFGICNSLTSAFFLGNAPPDTGSIFLADSAVVYYLAGTTGWGATFGGAPTALWNPTLQTTDGSFGVQNNQFGFNLTGTTNIPVRLEAATNLNQSSWSPLFIGTITNGSLYLSDPNWTNYPQRFYRVRSP